MPGADEALPVRADGALLGTRGVVAERLLDERLHELHVLAAVLAEHARGAHELLVRGSLLVEPAGQRGHRMRVGADAPHAGEMKPPRGRDLLLLVDHAARGVVHHGTLVLPLVKVEAQRAGRVTHRVVERCLRPLAQRDTGEAVVVQPPRVVALLERGEILLEAHLEDGLHGERRHLATRSEVAGHLARRKPDELLAQGGVAHAALGVGGEDVVEELGVRAHHDAHVERHVVPDDDGVLVLAPRAQEAGAFVGRDGALHAVVGCVGEHDGRRGEAPGYDAEGLGVERDERCARRGHGVSNGHKEPPAA